MSKLKKHQLIEKNSPKCQGLNMSSRSQCEKFSMCLTIVGVILLHYRIDHLDIIKTPLPTQLKLLDDQTFTLSHNCITSFLIGSKDQFFIHQATPFLSIIMCYLSERVILNPLSNITLNRNGKLYFFEVSILSIQINQP